MSPRCNNRDADAAQHRGWDLLVVGTTAVITSRQLFEERFTIGVSCIKLMAKQTAITER